MIDIEKFICSLIKHYCEAYSIDRTLIRCWFDDVLEEQGLEYKDGKIVKTQRRVAAEAKEAIFESEDERMKNAAIRACKYMIDNFENSTKDYEDAIAWLEKQCNEPNWCHHKVDLSDCTEEYRKAYYDGWNNCNQQHSQCKSELDDVVKCLINGMRFYYENNKNATWGTVNWSMPVKHIIEVLEKQSEQILANSAKTCKDEKKTDKYEGYCEGCNNVKGCVTCVDGDQWAHYKEVEQKPIKMWHDASEIPYLYEEEDLLVECGTRNYVVKYNPDTKQFLSFSRGFPVNGVIRWAYVSDVLTQSVTKISEQVWSEEDEKMSENILSHLREYYVQKKGYPYVADLNSPEMEEFGWFKTLKKRLGGK